jgi:hypothetical protein
LRGSKTKLNFFSFFRHQRPQTGIPPAASLVCKPCSLILFFSPSDLYRKYIDLKKASSGIHGTAVKESAHVSKETPSVAKETESLATETACHNKETSSSGAGMKDGNSLHMHGESDDQCSLGTSQPVSILKEKAPEVNIGNASEKSSINTVDEKLKSKATPASSDTEDVWGLGLNRAAESKDSTDKEMEKKSKGSLFEKIGKRMLSKAMQAPKVHF